MKNSLSAHLRHGDQHAALPFHAECPICRDERLAGTLEPSRLVPARGSAALAAGVLALSAAVPPATIAQEHDQVREGVVAPDAPAEDQSHDPDFDPGGTSVVLPDEPTASPPLPASDITDADGPVEEDTDADLQMPVEGAGDAAPVVDVPQTQPPAAAPPPAVETPLAPTPPAPPTAAEPTTPESLAADDEEAFETERRRKTADRRTVSGPEDRSVPARHQEATIAEPAASSGGDYVEPLATTESVATNGVAPGAGTATKAHVTVAVGDRIDRSERVYVVREGDSLWSIAADRLGDDASVAAIAREVDRLWQLNRGRIATGDPDLLRVGTHLALQ